MLPLCNQHAVRVRGGQLDRVTGSEFLATCLVFPALESVAVASDCVSSGLRDRRLCNVTGLAINLEVALNTWWRRRATVRVVAQRVLRRPHCLEGVSFEQLLPGLRGGSGRPYGDICPRLVGIGVGCAEQSRAIRPVHEGVAIANGLFGEEARARRN